MTVWANPTSLPVRIQARIGVKPVEFECAPGDLIEIPDVLDSAVAAKAPQLKRAEDATAKAAPVPVVLEPKAMQEASPMASEPEAVGDDVDPFTGQKKGSGKRR